MQSPTAMTRPTEDELAFLKRSAEKHWETSAMAIDPSTPGPFARYMNMTPPTPVHLLKLPCSTGDIDEALKTYVSSIGNKFFREEEQLIEPRFFLGKLREITFVQYYTLSRKGEETMCALAVLEKMPKFSTTEPASDPIEVGHQWFNWGIFVSALDPFGADNFTYFLGEDIRARRAVVPPGSPPSRFVVLKPTPAEPCIEYRVFFMNKLRYHIHYVYTKQDPQSIYYGACKSRGMDVAGLRAILGPLADVVETAESMVANIEGVVPESTLKELKKVELGDLHTFILEQSCPEDFFRLYKIWLMSLTDAVPIDLHPVEYQKYGRRFLMSQDELLNWDECSFLLILGARAQALSKSPLEASIFYGNGSYTYAEVSPHDNHWASKTSKGDKLIDIANDANKVGWIFDTLEDIVVKENAFFEKLEPLCNDPDTIIDAYLLLTEGTVSPRVGQNLLGLSESLLIRLAKHEIIFHPDLISMIKATMTHYGDWTLPLPRLEFDTRLRPSTDILFKIGELRAPAVPPQPDSP